MDKKYKTRDGRDVRVLCVDSGNETFPVVAIDCGKSWMYTACGHLRNDCVGMSDDLIEVKEKHVRWVNVYSDDYATKSLADTAYEMAVAQGYYGPKRIACIKIEFEEGEGL